MFVVDTNILIYAAIEECPHHETARTCLESWRRDVLPWHSTWGVFYEFVRVVTHPRVFSIPLSASEAWRFLDSVAVSPSFSLLVETERHRQVVEEIGGELDDLRGNIWHDAHIAALLREHGLSEIRTTDTDFHRFGFLKVVNPLVGS